MREEVLVYVSIHKINPNFDVLNLADYSVLSACVDRLANMLRKHMNKELKQYGINYSQWRVLRALEYDEINTPAQLAKLIYVETAAISLCLDQLELMQYISRSRGNTDDRRMTQIELTETGKEITLKGLQCAAEILSAADHGLNPNQISSLETLYRQSLKLT